MAKNRQHQWEPVPGSEDLVRCKKCGTEVTTIRARQGAGPCKWGEKAEPATCAKTQTEDSIPEIIIVCAGGCGKTTEGMTSETRSGEFTEATDPESMVPEWTCRECYDKREVNLCDTCTKQPAECDGLPKFGTGVGEDNVYECDGYIEGEKPAWKAPEPPKYPGPRLTDPPEHCNACGEHIAILPLNSRIDMVACNNRRCTLYRERLRTVTKPVTRGKKKRAN